MTGGLEDRRRELGQAAASGAAWSYASFVLSKLVVFASTIALARLLAPAEFGVVGYALVLIGYLDIARDLGVGAALIARPRIDHRSASTAFQLSVGWGLFLTAAVYLAAPLLGDFFRDARAVPVTRALSLGFLLSTLGSTHDALLYRNLAFSRRVVPDVVQAGLKSAIGVGLALAGLGYWSLVAGQLAGQAGFCLAAWAMQPFRPRFEWDASAGRWLLGFGTAIVGARLAAALLNNLSFLIVGSELGAESLGLYTLAYRVPDLVFTDSFFIISQVLFPVYARLRDDGEGLKRGYFLAQRYLALFALPIGIGMVLAAPLFVQTVYGPGWMAAGPIMQVLAVRCALAAIGWHAGDIARAVGRAWLQLVLTIVPALVLIPVLLFAARSYGLVGVAAAYALGTLLGSVLRTALVLRWVVRLSAADSARALGPALVAALAVALAGGGFLLLSQSWSDAARLIGVVAVGGAAYLASLSVVGRDLLDRLLGHLWRARFPGAAAPT